MAWGLWNKIKQGVKKAGNFAKKAAHHNGKAVWRGFTPPSRSYRIFTPNLRPHDTFHEPPPRKAFHTDSLGIIDWRFLKRNHQTSKTIMIFSHT